LGDDVHGFGFVPEPRILFLRIRWPNAPEGMVARLDANGNMVKDG
jgi:hypothetical protein